MIVAYKLFYLKFVNFVTDPPFQPFLPAFYHSLLESSCNCIKPSFLHFMISFSPVRLKNHSTSQKDNHATSNKDNHATSQRENHASLPRDVGGATNVKMYYSK